MIRHVGYAVVDSKGDVFIKDYLTDPNELESSLEEVIENKNERDVKWPEFSPHKVVRLLIDDEPVNEQ